MSYTPLWFIFSHNGDLLLRVSNAAYTLPQEENPPIEVGKLLHTIDWHPEPIAEGKSDAPCTAPPCEVIAAQATDSQVATISAKESDLKFIPLRECYFILSAELYALAAKMEELLHWHIHSRFCPCCGTQMQRATQISKRCPSCGYEAWPSLQIAIIVLIKREPGELLLVRAKNFKGHYMGLVAGFVETGETLEQAVEREVSEETGLKIRNLRYFKSQIWPFPSNLMAAFVADYHSGTLRLQQSELADGGWFTRDTLPPLPDQASIARQMIEEWKKGTI